LKTPFVTKDFSLLKNGELGEEKFTFDEGYSYRTPYTRIYYKNGIPFFDEFLKGDKFFEHKFLFIISGYENAIVFFLINSKCNVKQVLNRENITRFEMSEPKEVEIVTFSNIINIFKTGAYGGGFIGSLASTGIGHLSEKIRGIKTKQVIGSEFYLYYLDEYNSEKSITIYASEEESPRLLVFLSALYRNTLEENNEN